jgi:signal transduction histidine kinase
MRTAQKGQVVEVSIIDTGCGIPHEYLERLFEPFFTTTEKGRGMGLGREGQRHGTGAVHLVRDHQERQRTH